MADSNPSEETHAAGPGQPTLRRSPDAQDVSDLEATRVGAPSPASPAPAEGRPFGRYVLLEELGRGGMGIVWKAWDTQLSRIVALKQVLGCDARGDESVQRFLREARLAAKLRHPRIVTVHDVGVHEGRHYFTSDYIQGRTLAKALSDCTFRQGVTWIRGIAEGLAYAHEQGVIHRDVKPSNIMVDAAGQAFIMDFGLAREVEAGSGLTLTGELTGTPSYMSPEQASGRVHDVGAATDQFSLGATLYEVLTRRQPFQAEDLRGMLNAVAEEDPAPPSSVNPHVHRDLDTICLRAMAKGPAERYPSMRDLAADLGRWLEGEPIAARSTSGAERLWRWVLKRRAIVIPSIAALLLAIGFGVYAGMTHVRRLQAEAQQARDLEAAYGKQYRVSQVLSRFRALTPMLRELEALHYGSEPGTAGEENGPSRADMDVTKQDLQRRRDELWAQVQAFIVDTPKDAASQATMWPLAGWTRRLYGEERVAEEWMQKGTALDAEVPFGSFLLAMVHFSEYVDEQPLPMISVAIGSGLQALAKPAETAEMRRHSGEMQAPLHAAEGAKLWGMEGVNDYKATLEAVRAFQREEYDAAEAGLTRAIEGTVMEPMRISLLWARAKVRYFKRDFDGADEDITEVVASRPGRVRAWLDRGLILRTLGQFRSWRGLEAGEVLRRSIASYDEGLRREIASVDGYLGRGQARESLGEEEEARGIDARQEYRSALSDLDQALRLRPEDITALRSRSLAWWMLGRAEAKRGNDPRPFCQRAIADCDETLRRDPSLVSAYNTRGCARNELGDAEAARAIDPRESYARAIADLSEALRRDAESAEVYDNRGSAHARMGEAQEVRGIDPGESYAEAIADYSEALRRNPQFGTAYCNRGTAEALLGKTLAARGEEPRATYEKALSDLDQALKYNPNNAEAYGGRGYTCLLMGQREADKGIDPRATYEKGIASLNEAQKLNPARFWTYLNRAQIDLRLGDAEAARGIDSRARYVQAIADCTDAAARNPVDIQSLTVRAFARLTLGIGEEQRGMDARGRFEAAVADCDEVLRRSPHFADAFRHRALAYRHLGIAEETRGADPRERYRKAIADLDEVLRLSPQAQDALVNRGNAYLSLGGAEAGRGIDPRKSYEAAIADLSAAFVRERNAWDLHAGLGSAYEAIGEPGKAVVEYEAALAIVKDGYPPLKEWLARAKAAAEKK